LEYDNRNSSADPTKGRLQRLAMKKDVGLGLRLMMHKAVFRFEIAGGEDDVSTWAMVGRPF
jgi:hypothetical protein